MCNIEIANEEQNYRSLLCCNCDSILYSMIVEKCLEIVRRPDRSRLSSVVEKADRGSSKNQLDREEF